MWTALRAVDRQAAHSDHIPKQPQATARMLRIFRMPMLNPAQREASQIICRDALVSWLSAKKLTVFFAIPSGARNAFGFPGPSGRQT